MDTKTTTKTATKKDAKLNAARKNLDAAMTKRDPHPERVLAAFLGWKEGILAEFHRAEQLTRQFNLTGSYHEWRPGFEFMADILGQLETAENAFEQMPGMDSRSTEELESEILDLLGAA